MDVVVGGLDGVADVQLHVVDAVERHEVLGAGGLRCDDGLGAHGVGPSSRSSSLHDCAGQGVETRRICCVTVPSLRQMDDIDRQIVALLRQDARRSFQSIGLRVSLSAPAVKRRVDRLEAAGVVRGYTAAVDPGRFGWGTHAFVELSCEGRMAAAEVREAVERHPEVEAAYTVAGRGERDPARARAGHRPPGGDARADPRPPRRDAHADADRALDAVRAAVRGASGFLGVAGAGGVAGGASRRNGMALRGRGLAFPGLGVGLLGSSDDPHRARWAGSCLAHALTRSRGQPGTNSPSRTSAMPLRRSKPPATSPAPATRTPTFTRPQHTRGTLRLMPRLGLIVVLIVILAVVVVVVTSSGGDDAPSRQRPTPTPTPTTAPQSSIEPEGITEHLRALRDAAGPERTRAAGQRRRRRHRPLHRRPAARRRLPRHRAGVPRAAVPRAQAADDRRAAPRARLPDADVLRLGQARRAGCGASASAAARTTTLRRGEVAVADRGVCTFTRKAQLAQRAGAAALLVVNDSGAPFSGSLIGPGVRIPVLAVSTARGPRSSETAFASRSTPSRASARPAT